MCPVPGTVTPARASPSLSTLGAVDLGVDLGLASQPVSLAIEGSADDFPSPQFPPPKPETREWRPSNVNGTHLPLATPALWYFRVMVRFANAKRHTIQINHETL